MTKSGEKMEKAEWRFPRWRRDAVGRCDEEGSPQARDPQRPDEKAHLWVYVQNDEDEGIVVVSVSTANDIGIEDDFEVTLYAGGRSHDFAWYEQFLFADNPPITSNANDAPSITHEQVTAVSARVGDRALKGGGPRRGKDRTVFACNYRNPGRGDRTRTLPDDAGEGWR